MKNAPIILIGILCSIFLAANGEKECPLKAAFTKSIEACKDKISEESAKLLDDDQFADNEEIRAFKACVLIHGGIMEDKKIDSDKIQEIIKDYVDDEEMESVMAAIKLCKVEAEVGSNDGEVATIFINCFVEAIDDGDDSDSGK